MSKARRPDKSPPNQFESQPPAPAAAHWARVARDWVEMIAIAFALAFLFKAFEAEAFVIPTGSMAPTLMGRHKDVVCPECGFHYTASSSDEADRNGSLRRTHTGALDERFQVVECTCPNCRYTMSVDPKDKAGGEEHPSYNGDRIWVSRVAYQFLDPRRWDVIVFRYPQEAETYYIKRLVGLPNEIVKIRHGDIYTKGPGDADFVLRRKPPKKILAMAQVVYDNDYQSSALVEAGWPARWQLRDEEGKASTWRVAPDGRSFSTDGTTDVETWLRYEHTVPADSFWRGHADGRQPPRRDPRPQLITDFYAFNTRVLRQFSDYGMQPSALGLHWVGDLIVDCEVDVRGTKGSLLLDLVKGGRHFRATINVADGQAQLSIDGLTDWRPTAKTSVRGGGTYRLMLANVDRQLVLWIDGKVVTFDQPTQYDDLDNDRPRANHPDGSDLAPVGIGARGAAVDVRHLRVLRDVYYIADRSLDNSPISDFRARNSLVPLLRNSELIEFLSSPSEWDFGGGRNAFDDRQSLEFELGPDQFFVLGDNSPASADARFWQGEHFVDRNLLVGKALLIFWPHPLDLPIPLTDTSLPVIPNVPEMEFIR